MTAEEKLASEILAELSRARSKFPGNNVTMLALMEEVGELAKATFEEPRDAVRKEAVQVATMAMRVVLDGDVTLDSWRTMKGLDPLLADTGGGATTADEKLGEAMAVAKLRAAGWLLIPPFDTPEGKAAVKRAAETLWADLEDRPDAQDFRIVARTLRAKLEARDAPDE